MLSLFKHNPPRTVILDEATGRYHVRRPAKHPTPENPFEYYDRFDSGEWVSAKSQVLDAFSSEEAARAFAFPGPPPTDRGETDRVIAS